MRLTALFNPLFRFLRGEEKPWIAFAAWFLLGNTLMIFFFYDVSKWATFSYFEQKTAAPYAMHYNFVDTTLTLFMLITGVGAFICGMRSGTASGKAVSGLTVVSALLLLLLMGMTSKMPPEIQAEMENQAKKLQSQQNDSGSAYDSPSDDAESRYRAIMEQPDAAQQPSP